MPLSILPLKKKNAVALLIVSILIMFISFATTLVYITTHSQNTEAVTAENFDPGTIISQVNFINNKSMSSSDIQKFLNDKNSVCLKNYNGLALIDANKNGQIEDWTTSEQYGGSTGKQTMTAAQLIKSAADTYGINPQVLLVTLEKEQGLITRSDCPTWRYNTAFGFGCPDTAPCDKAAYGFTRQLDNAAYHFKNYMTGEDVFGNKVYSTYKTGYQPISYHPGPCKTYNSKDECIEYEGRYGNIPDNSYCGRPSVNITNRATASLYTYTPYQPNRASLNAGYGSGDKCSSYGNRNFHLFYTGWFGNIKADGFKSLDIQRWMQIKSPVKKVNVHDGVAYGPVLDPGRDIKFIDKIYINGEWLLRTEWDKKGNNPHGIPLSSLEEIPVVDIEPVWKVIPNGTRKVDPVRQNNYEFIEGKTAIKVVDTISVNDNLFFRTEWESQHNRIRVIPAKDLSDYTLVNLIDPRYMILKSDTQRVNILTGEKSSEFKRGSIYFFNKRITVDGVTYIQPSVDADTQYGIPLSEVDEVSNESILTAIVSLDVPRWMTVNTPVQKKHISNSESFGPILSTGRHINFVDKIYVDGVWLLRTEWDAAGNNLDGIPLSALGEIRAKKITPIRLHLKRNTQKVDPVRGITYERIPHSKYPSLVFVDKITVNGSVYYRTQWESQSGNNKFISEIDLTE